jgi:hypothetical protein
MFKFDLPIDFPSVLAIVYGNFGSSFVPKLIRRIPGPQQQENETNPQLNQVGTRRCHRIYCQWLACCQLNQKAELACCQWLARCLDLSDPIALGPFGSSAMAFGSFATAFEAFGVFIWFAPTLLVANDWQ